MFTAVAFLELYLIVQNIISLKSQPMHLWNTWKWINFAMTVLLAIFFVFTFYFSIQEIKEKVQKSKALSQKEEKGAATDLENNED